MSESKFKTMRHIETVRNYINLVIKQLIYRAEHHDQSKLQSPEVDIFEEYTSKLRGITYGSEEYKKCLKEIKPALDHHYKANSHHPEHSKIGINGMHLIDLIEWLCDCKAATLRHNDGDIYKSLKINKERFGISGQLYEILKNTVDMLELIDVYHNANES